MNHDVSSKISLPIQFGVSLCQFHVDANDAATFLGYPAE